MASIDKQQIISTLRSLLQQERRQGLSNPGVSFYGAGFIHALHLAGHSLDFENVATETELYTKAFTLDGERYEV